MAPVNSTLVVVVNNTTGGALPGSNGTFRLIVEGFLDTQFTSVPEPSGVILTASALAALGLLRARRRLPRLISVLALLALAKIPIFAQAISNSARQQIVDILTVKKSFNAAEQKMSSDLAFASRVLRGGVPNSVAHLVNSLADPNSVVEVDIKGIPAPTLLSQIVGMGGQVRQSLPQQRHIRAQVPLWAVSAIAGSKTVNWIREADQGTTNSVVPFESPFRHVDMSRVRLSPERRRAEIRQQLERELAMLLLLAANGHFPSLSSWFRPKGMAFFIGLLTSQGYISHQAREVIHNLGYTGSGVKVGVLSDSASAARVAALIASGDLPANTVVLPGQAGPATGADEGTAMMEIVSDMAPGAQLYFATALPSSASFAANILALRAAGCDIIVDDFTYFAEGVFQDGIIAQAVNSVVASGALYFSSGANSGSLTKGTSGTWEGDFLNGGAVSGSISALEPGFFHNFGTPGDPQNYDVVTTVGGFFSLKWSDPLGGSANDYDLLLLDSTVTTVKKFSAASQTGTQDPYEFIRIASPNTPSAGDRIVVVQFSGAARALHVGTERGRLSISTTGATYGHNAGLNTITAAATYWDSAKTGTQPFTGFANTVETFNSDGPRKIFYNPNGVAITPGNFLFGTNGGITLQKPDLSAADGTTARTPGFNPFFGTSAAAPHLAGIAALVKSARPALTNTQIRAIMTSTALDNMAVGPDRDGGYGVAMALAAVQAALALP